MASASHPHSLPGDGNGNGDRCHRVALVCDFFYPRLGGVENHIYALAQHLIKGGHKVVVITHAYACPDGSTRRTGVRYLPGPLKVYYCPFLPMTDEDCLPTFTSTLPLLRHIFVRERISIVHSHQATSTLANEALVYASELGLRSVYTDHSLFGFDDVASLVLNRVLKVTLSTVDAAICVSHTCRDNLIIRAAMDPSVVHVVPNAVDTSKFTTDISKRPTDGRIIIVVVSRLVYRKGVDLLVGIIPRICAAFPCVDFIVGGDGAKRLDLEEMVERERLQDRVTFCGSIPHSQVREVLVRGHIFLNCSLTESFCIALLEAASCGLFVVSTNVGGVPEVLPDDMVHLAEPSVAGLVDGLSRAIKGRVADAVDPNEFHLRVKRMYSWQRVARDTARIYDRVMARQRPTFLERVARYKSVGGLAGYISCLLHCTLHFYVRLVQWWLPEDVIDVVPDLPQASMKEIAEKFVVPTG